MNKNIKGYLLGGIAAITYGMNPLFTLPLYKDGLNYDSVLFFRYLFALPIIALMIKTRGRSFKVAPTKIVPLIFMGILFSLSSLTLFKSYNYMDAGIASTLLFVYPVMVALIMIFVFKEKFNFTTSLCVLLVCAGIYLLYKNKDGNTLSFIGTLLVFGSALSYALYIVGVNHSLLKDVPTVNITFYVLVFGVCLFAIRLLILGAIQLPSQWYLWGNLLALALFPTAISLLCTTKAIQYIGSTPTAILGSLEPLTAIFFGVTIFGESLTVRIITGFILIIIAVIIIITKSNIASILIRFRKLFPKQSKKQKKSGKNYTH